MHHHLLARLGRGLVAASLAATMLAVPTIANASPGAPTAEQPEDGPTDKPDKPGGDKPETDDDVWEMLDEYIEVFGRLAKEWAGSAGSWDWPDWAGGDDEEPVVIDPPEPPATDTPCGELLGNQQRILEKMERLIDANDHPDEFTGAFNGKGEIVWTHKQSEDADQAFRTMWHQLDMLAIGAIHREKLMDENGC